ncbi:MAG TPA: ATP synthase F1 subunit delta [Thermoanaerobaculia bacterium]|nr:ATP synthase F1 subunit delta [Thermoanaerobaculia bacterium]
MIRRFARPYARAIMDVTKTPDAAAPVRDDLAKFEQVRAAAADLQQVYANPGIETDAKIKITRTIAQRLGMSELSGRVLEVLIGNHRINDLGSIVEALAEMIRQATGTLAAEVRSAHRLTPDEQAALARTLEQKFGRKIEVTVTTDPALLGGFVAKVGSEVFDASVSGKIHRFRESLT